MTSINFDLPADEGRRSYLNKIHHNANPYTPHDWRHEEWWFGWKTEEECDGDSFDWQIDNFKANLHNNGSTE